LPVNGLEQSAAAVIGGQYLQSRLFWRERRRFAVADVERLLEASGGIYHTYGTENVRGPSEPGQDGRHVDLIWPIWNLFDFTPEGRGTKWYPKLEYES